MELLFSYKKKAKISETESEFYLNRRDSFLNGKPLNYNSLIYLAGNEYMAILFEEQIIFIDLKISIIDSMKIVKQEYYNNLYEKLFPKSTKTEIKSSKLQNGQGKLDEIKFSKSFEKIVPIFNKNNEKITPLEIKIIESKVLSNDFIIIILFSNYELAIFSYFIDSQNYNESTITPILAIKDYKHSSVLDKIKFLGSKQSNSSFDLFYTKLVVLTPQTELFSTAEKKNFEYSLIGVYKNLQLEIYFLLRRIDPSSTQNEFMLHPLIRLELNFHMVNNPACLFINVQNFKRILISINNPDFSIDTVEVKFKIEAIPTKPFKNPIKPKDYNLNSINIRYNETIYFDNYNFSFNYKFASANKIDFEHVIVNGALNYSMVNSEIYLLVSKLNKVHIYKNSSNKNEFTEVKKVIFDNFEGSVLAHIFLTKLGDLYVFNRFSQHSKENIFENEINQIRNSGIDLMQLSNEVYGVCQMKQEFGFFILSVNNIIKFADLSLEVLLVDRVKAVKIFENLTFADTNENNLNFPSINEILFLLKQNFVNFCDDKKLDLSLNHCKIAYLKSRMEENNEKANFFKNVALKHIRKMKSFKLKDDEIFCEFCTKKCSKLNELENTMVCEDDHPTYVCCLSKNKITDQSYQCEFCSLFYNKESMWEAKSFPNYKCYICQCNL